MTRVVVVDTNVPIVANGDSAASLDCQEACVLKLLAISRGEAKVAVDDGGLIVDEYAHKLQAGAQGVGHEFLKWIYTRQWDETCCDQIAISPSDELGFAEFPTAAALAKFDLSDRKFVAVAVAHGARPPILQAADAKWVGWAPALAVAGVAVEFLCPDEIKAKYEAKHAKR